MNQRLKRSLLVLTKMIFAGAIIVWLVQNNSLDFHVLLELAHPKYLIPLLALLVVNLCLNHYRWLLLLRAQGIDVTYASTLPLSFIGLFFNFAFPGGVGGDVVKGYYLLRDQPSRKLGATVTVLLDRIMGLFSMLVLSGLALILNPTIAMSSPEMKTLSLLVGVCILMGSLFCLFVFSSSMDHLSVEKLPRFKIFALVRRLHATVLGFRAADWIWLKCILVSWCSQLATIGFIVLVVQLTEPGRLPWHTYFFVVPLGFMAMALPIAPAGVGVGQAAFFFLFKLYTGEESQVGPNAITAFQAAQLCLSLVGAVLFLQKRRSQPALNPVRAERV